MNFVARHPNLSTLLMAIGIVALSLMVLLAITPPNF
jgi:DMSO/TMAO reductase YedYZ heme-binding membrane subunit